MATISVDVFDKAEIKEDQTTEFKTSIFVDPKKSQAGFVQMRTIADTLAAFMNADGGMLYVGIADNKDIRGIEQDLRILATEPTSVVVRSPRHNDETFTYGGTTDKYELKIRAIVKAYLSSNASGYLGKVNFGTVRGKIICRIEAKKCKPDDFVYSYYKYGSSKTEVAEIYKRFGNQKRRLEGVERDEFVRERTRQQVLANVNAVVAQNPAGLVDRVIAAINNAFTTQVVGRSVTIEGAVALDDANFASVSTPKGLVFDGKHVRDVGTWKELYEALLVKLNEIDASKFDGIAEEPFFSKKWFVEVKPHKKYADYYKDKLGTAANVRGYCKIGKTHFVKHDYVVWRLLERCGISASRIAVRG